MSPTEDYIELLRRIKKLKGGMEDHHVFIAQIVGAVQLWLRTDGPQESDLKDMPPDAIIAMVSKMGKQ